MIFAYRTGDKVRLEIESLTDKLELDRGNRQQQVAKYAQAFASALEKRCRLAPFQWFNFFDFWSNDQAGSQAETKTSEREVAADKNGSS